MAQIKNKKVIWIIVIILALLLGGIYLSANWNPETTLSQNAGDEIDQITSTVKAFGGKLKTVSLLAPEPALKDDINQNYAQYITSDLLAKWQKDPVNAPGRRTSSPWPDRIEIISINQADQSHYVVNGEVVEMTSADLASSTEAGRYPVKITMEIENGKWLISEFETETPSGE